jgi:hypothetical protein
MERIPPCCQISLKKEGILFWKSATGGGSLFFCWSRKSNHVMSFLQVSMAPEFRKIACGREASIIFRKVFNCLSHAEMRVCILTLFIWFSTNFATGCVPTMIRPFPIPVFGVARFSKKNC